MIDSDGHVITRNNDLTSINDAKEIFIGNHVWIGAKASILKGSYIADDSVVGYGSIVTGKLMEKNSVYTGIPATLKKGDIDWIR